MKETKELRVFRITRRACKKLKWKTVTLKLS